MALLVALLSLALVRAGVTEEQLNCLYRIYDETGGENWHVKTNWPPPKLRVFPHNACKFAGITCSLKGNITKIILSGNNLVGSLPGCLHVFEVSDMEFSTNKLKGEFPRVNCKKLDTLYYKFNEITTLPSNICECNSLQYLHIEYNNMQGHPLPQCLLEKSSRFGILYAVNTNLYLQEGSKYSLASTNLVLGGNNLGLDFSTEHMAICPDTTMLDISATKSTGLVNISELFAKYPAIRELNLQENAFTGDPFTSARLKPSSFLQVLDMHNNRFSSVLRLDALVHYFGQYPEKLIVFRVGRNHISGLPPTNKMLHQIRKMLPNLQVLDFGENPFLCPLDASDIPVDCTYLFIEKTSIVKSASVQVTLYLSSKKALKHLPVELLHPYLSISLKNVTAGAAANIWHTFPFDGTISIHDAINNEYRAVFEISKSDAISLFGAGFQTIMPNQIRILFDGECVSISDRPEFRSTRLSETPVVEDAIPASASISASASASNLKVLIEFYGISKCPGYISTVTELINPFIQQYPELLQLADFRFVSQADAEERYSAHGITMHGQGEVFGDRFLMCLQEYTDYFVFNDVTTCLYKDGTNLAIPYGIEDCLSQVISDRVLRKRIMNCRNGEMATSLLLKSKSKCRDLGAAFSCTIFADSQLVCPFGDETCPFDPKDVESFAKYLCDLYRAKNLYMHDMCKLLLE